MLPDADRAHDVYVAVREARRAVDALHAARVRVDKHHAELAAECSRLVFAVESWSERVKAMLADQ